MEHQPVRRQEQDRSKRPWATMHPVVVFTVLTFALSWLAWLPVLVTDSQAQWPFVLGAFGPALAAAVMVRLRGEKLRAWLRGILRLRVAPRWYVVALALPLADPAIQTVLAWQAGLDSSPAALAERLPLYVGAFVFVMVLGGGQEELGWRGWLLPQMQRRRSPLTASLVIGVIHALWHLPLFVLGWSGYRESSFALYLPATVAFAVVATWLFNSGRGSVIVAIVFHTQLNVASSLVPVRDLAGYEQAVTDGTVSVVTLQALLTAAWILFAVLVILRDRRLGHRPG